MCCGVQDINDWNALNYSNPIEINNVNGKETIYEKYPQSCCHLRGYPEKCTPYENACLNRLTYIISESAVMLGTGALCIAFVQVS